MSPKNGWHKSRQRPPKSIFRPLKWTAYALRAARGRLQLQPRNRSCRELCFCSFSACHFLSHSDWTPTPCRARPLWDLLRYCHTELDFSGLASTVCRTYSQKLRSTDRKKNLFLLHRRKEKTSVRMPHTNVPDDSMTSLRELRAAAGTVSVPNQPQLPLDLLTSSV